VSTDGVNKRSQQLHRGRGVGGGVKCVKNENVF
jgi:succinyl-CoA synthetase beta subunit